jgi:uncharacterized protein YcnI
MPRRLGAVVSIGLAAVTLTLLAAGPAVAHVTVNPDEAEQGGFTKLAFSTPNERDNASTVKLEVILPTDHPLAFVSVQPHPGWSYTVQRRTLAEPIEVFGSQVTEVVSSVTFSADSPATSIGPGEFDEFNLSVGPLPEVDQIVFKAIQTYSSAEVVRWVEQAVGHAEPEHPAPVLHLVPPQSEPARAPAAQTETSSNDNGSGVHTSLALSIVALALSGVAVALSVRRRT